LSELSPFVSVPAGAAVAYFTDWARQALDKILAGEPVFRDMFDEPARYDYESMADQAGSAGFGRAARLGIEAFNTAVGTNAVMQAKWLAAHDEALRRGTTLTFNQTAGLCALMEKERDIAENAATFDLIYDSRTKRWLQAIPKPVSADWPKFMPSISEMPWPSAMTRDAAAIDPSAPRRDVAAPGAIPENPTGDRSVP
jgi:hypothetical protein